MADNYLTGKQGSVKIGATSYSFEAWNCALKCKLPEITNFTSGGFQAMLSGIVSGTVSVNGPYNNSNMPFVAGTTYTWLLCFTDAILLTVPAIIESIGIDDKVSDSPRINITAQSTGVFTAAIV